MVGMALLLGAHQRGFAAEQASSKHPNVLFLAVDDLNDWISALGGHPASRTPNIDRLIARGVLFTNAHCAAPACNPSRVALLTGLKPSTTGVYTNNSIWRKVLPDAVTLPQYFMAHGYWAEGIGKIFHGRFKDPESWNRYTSVGSFPKPATTPANGIKGTAHFDWGPVSESDAEMGDTKSVETAITFLESQPKEPYFLAVGIYRPHLPWYVPQEYFDKHPVEGIVLPEVKADDLKDIPAAGVKMARPQGDHRKVTKSENWHKAVQGYLASIAYTDAMVGRLVDALDASPKGKETIIVLWSDHGWHLGEKEHWRKFALWERATRVPLAFVVPGVTKPGERCSRPVNLVDVYPTLLEVCGLPPKKGLDGHSLVPLLENPEASWDHYSLTTHGRKNHAVRSERYRYIRYADGSEEFYDHQSDPNEWTNRASEKSLRPIIEEHALELPAKDAKDAPSVKGRKKAKEKKQKA
ncbi:Choline-sulfatase [Planctomycetes bacterium Pan216]|uniref:Choline-sulfatase n=1 Tax=Kolteria novifilia TaxID=2527975 RepID=A0A518BCY2_9BACT|nr:Choline-sulfatase [Planctomycetes bacterium Pan216]